MMMQRPETSSLVTGGDAVPKVVCFSDTFGSHSNNGVGRFLEDLLGFSRDNHLPLNLVVPGKGESGKGVIRVRAPSFTLPVYSKVSVSVPLEAQRRTLRRQLAELKPQIIHVSTPGPFGCLGLSLASEFKLPVIGTFHTDFPSYARELIRNHFDEMKASLITALRPLALQCLGKAGPLLAQLTQANPEFEQDVAVVAELIQKNLHAMGEHKRPRDVVAKLAESLISDILRRFYSKFSMVLARSQAQEATLVNEIGLHPDRVRLLPPGTDTRLFHPNHADRSVLTSLGIPESAFVVLYVGRVTAEKNVQLLFDVWSRLTRHQTGQQPECHLVIAGYGDEAELKRARELPAVHVVGPKVGHDLSVLYATSDLLLFPSVTETLGQVGLEAAASGTPILAATVGGQTTYVVDGKTGFLLSASEPQCWSEKIAELAGAPEQVSRMGRAARIAVESRYTIEHSLGRYWELHAEARSLALAEKHIRIRAKRDLSNQTFSVPENIEAPGIMLISDYHAGRHYGNPNDRRRKQMAFEAMLSLAVERNLEVVLGGDFGDHGSNPSRLEADFKSLREIKERLLPGASPTFIRGNHDFGYSDQQLMDYLGGCEIHPSLVYFHEASRVLVTHGHILGLARVREIANDTRSHQLLQQDLTESRLDEELKPSIIAYDLANLVESSLQPMGLSGLNIFWEGLYKYRADSAERLVEFSRRADQADQKTWKLMASLLGSYDDTQTAYELGSACGSWATLFGHTHEPMARRIRARSSSSKSSVQLVGNAGNVNCKQPTCVIAEFPRVFVYAFDASAGKMKIKSRTSLTEIETLRYSSRFPKCSTSAAVC